VFLTRMLDAQAERCPPFSMSFSETSLASYWVLTGHWARRSAR
jgi:hypothetical protein